MARRSVRAWLAAVSLAAAILAPAVAAAASVPATVTPPASKTATAPALGEWALDFTLPTFGKSGCLVCHGDPKLVVPKGAADVSYWVDEESYDKSVHARVVCTGCHSDFGFKSPHAKGSWKTAAKQACVACHEQQTSDFADGAHAVRPSAGGKKDPKAAEKPRCGDCHGAHDIQKLKDNPAGQAQLHRNGKKVCGEEGCHADFWDNYDDYYHGRAYKRGAEDAPACWDCHGAHTVLPSDSALSPVSDANIAETCSKGAKGDLRCHEGAEKDLAAYAPLIHGMDKVRGANPLYSLWTRVKSWFK